MSPPPIRDLQGVLLETFEKSQHDQQMNEAQTFYFYQISFIRPLKRALVSIDTLALVNWYKKVRLLASKYLAYLLR